MTSDGRVKILDFGLARQLSLPSAGQTHSPTAAQATEPGTVLGTVGYMGARAAPRPQMRAVSSSISRYAASLPGSNGSR